MVVARAGLARRPAARAVQVPTITLQTTLNAAAQVRDMNG